MTWLVRELTDKTQILSFLNTERLYAAYAIGDLEPRMFAQCTWAGGEQSNQLQALVLHYRGLKIPTLFIMGVTDGLRTILENVLLDTMYDLPSASSARKVVVDEAVVTGETKPYIIYESDDAPTVNIERPTGSDS